MGENTVATLFQTIIDSNDHCVDIFTDNISAVYAHPKCDIIEFCTELNEQKLKLLRSKLYEKFRYLLPCSFYSEGHSLRTRKKKLTLAEDIYVLGNSVVNKTEDSRLGKILKPQSAGDTSSLESDSSNSLDSILVQNYITMKQSIEDMTKQIGVLVTRTKHLETEVTVLKTVIAQLSQEKTEDKPFKKLEVDNVSIFSEEESEIDESQYYDLDIMDTNKAQSDLSKQIIVKAEVHHDINGVPQVIQSKGNKQNEITGFRHTRAQRKKIKRSKVAPETQNKNVSTSKVRAADTGVQSGKGHSGTYVVYIGRLKKETSEEDLRAHITDIGVPSDEIADVIPLRCRNEAQSSYCISLNSKSAESTVLCDKNWPHGVRVRLFHPRSRNNTRSTRLNSSSTSGNYHRNYHRNNYRNYQRTQVANYPYRAPRHHAKYAGSSRPFLKPQNNEPKGYQDSPDYYYPYYQYDEHYFDNEKYSQDDYDAYTWY